MLRKVLGEDAKHKFIETVAKKGYRFVAYVEKVSECEIPITAAHADGSDLFKLK